MAHIKCRYFEWRCNHPHRMTANTICHFPEDGDGCREFIGGLRQEGAENAFVIFNVCRHAARSYTQFEGDYKRYEYDDYAGLRISRRWVNPENIEFLEIDGKVLVGDEQQRQRQAR